MSANVPAAATPELAWFKSTYSSGEGGECIEVAWLKSSYSGAEGGECVEVATSTGAVLVRDSKDKSGPSLSFAPDQWAAFVDFAARL